MTYTRFIAARPETVVSLVNTGKYPDVLPDYINLPRNRFDCKSSVPGCLLNADRSLDQIFALQLALPTKYDPTELKPEWIKRIFVNSEKGSKLLVNLFNGACPRPIKIRPDYFAGIHDKSYEKLFHEQPEATRKKTAITDLEDVSSIVSAHETMPVLATPSVPQNQTLTQKMKALSQKTKSISSKRQAYSPKTNTLASALVLIFSDLLKPEKAKTSLADIERIETCDQHLSLLQKALKEAKKKILITTYGINKDTLESGSLYRLIREAKQRGVMIYIYSNDEKPVDEEIIEFLGKNVRIVSGAYTHSKILAVDESLVAVGSFNWLGGTDHKYALSQDATIVYRGDKCGRLIHDFWKYLTYYRDIQFNNYKKLKAFERNPLNKTSQEYDIGNDSILIYISMLDQQRQFIRQSLLAAKKRLVVCSPFISPHGNYTDDFDLQTLHEAANRGVDIYFVCKPDQIKKSGFDAYLAQLNHPRIHLVPINDIHLKSFIVDDHTIAEGSFNWLSASRNEKSPKHNHEVTLVTKGHSAKMLIEQGFDYSEVGKRLIS